jgi:hypothetical protein
MVWMTRSNCKRTIKLLSGNYGSQLMRQRDSTKGDGFVRSGKGYCGPAVSRPNSEDQLLYPVVLQGSEKTRDLTRSELLSLAVRQQKRWPCSRREFVAISQQFLLGSEIAMGTRNESRRSAKVQL